MKNMFNDDRILGETKNQNIIKEKRALDALIDDLDKLTEDEKTLANMNSLQLSLLRNRRKTMREYSVLLHERIMAVEK